MCGNKKDDQPTIQQIPFNQYQEQQNQLFSDVMVPWTKSRYEMSQNVYDPLSRQLGQELGNQLKSPMSLPEDVWANLWQKQSANVAGEYNKTRQSGTERAAGSGMLNQGPTEKYMQSLDLAQGKSMEDMAVSMAIA